MLRGGPESSRLRVVLAHGAGAPMDSDFMNDIASRLAGCGLHVLRFEFPYMARRRETGRRAAPDRAPVLLQLWRDVIEQIGEPSRTVIGGKSMGGRIASMVADETGVAGLICLGYPFHPPGKPERLRTAHLEQLATRSLIVQGTRDTLGSRPEVQGYRLSPSIRCEWLEDGDHSFKPRVRSGRSLEQNVAQAIDAIAAFVGSLD